MLLKRLLREVRACRVCEADLPFGPRLVLQVASTARLLIIGQAPGSKVHQSGIPLSDASGDRLRDWLKLGRSIFYDAARVAILPVGFLLSRGRRKRRR
jgi:uracil-DNA glycosylase